MFSRSLFKQSRELKGLQGCFVIKIVIAKKKSITQVFVLDIVIIFSTMRKERGRKKKKEAGNKKRLSDHV